MCEFSKVIAKWVRNLTWSTLRKWGIVVGVLVVANLLSAKIGYDRLNGNTVPGLTIDATLDQWIKASWGMDCSTYLAVAMNVANGKGLLQDPNAWDPNTHPFDWWGPGTPYVLGKWLRWTHGKTVWSCFLFSALAQFIWGAIAVAIAAQFTNRTWALAVTAILSVGFAPLHESLYSQLLLTSSEIVALVPLGMMFFALTKASLLLIKAESRLPLVLMWFAIAGLWIGLASLVRDSLSTFACFIAVFLLIATRLRNLRQIGIAIASGLVIVAVTEAVRYPVKQWNQNRIHNAVVSMSSGGAIWQVGLWSKHSWFEEHYRSTDSDHVNLVSKGDAHRWSASGAGRDDLAAQHVADEWFDNCGIGFGDFLDPAAAQRVRTYFDEKKPGGVWYSFSQLVQALWRHPLEALEFKLSRLPVLWLGTHRWPRCELNLNVIWCAAFYGLFLGYAVMRIRARRPIPMSLYLYLAFVVCASPLIHYEFRYTFPVLQMLIILPAAWAAHREEMQNTPLSPSRLIGAKAAPHFALPRRLQTEWIAGDEIAAS
jgi:hypothetical protein